MRAVKIARPVIECQPAFIRRLRHLVAGVLRADGADSPAGAVHRPRPGVRRIDLESALKAAIHAPLHGVVRRVSLTGANLPFPSVRIKTGTVWLERIDFIPSRQLMALRPDIGTIDHEFVRELPLKTKR